MGLDVSVVRIDRVEKGEFGGKSQRAVWQAQARQALGKTLVGKHGWEAWVYGQPSSLSDFLIWYKTSYVATISVVLML